MTARNHKAFDAAQAVRAAVRDILIAHSPLAPVLTAKLVNGLLPPHLRRADITIRQHIRALRSLENRAAPQRVY